MKPLGIRRPFIVAAMIAVAVVLIAIFFADTIPPATKTKNTLSITMHRIVDYVCANGHLPATLSDLPQRQRYDNDIRDGWGHAILYEIRPDKTVVLTSYGKDGQPGGDGDNADLVVAFKLTSKGAESRPSLEWTYESWHSNSSTTKP